MSRTRKDQQANGSEDDLRSPTLVGRRHVENQPPSHRTECASIVALQLLSTESCPTNQSIVYTRVPQQFDDVNLPDSSWTDFPVVGSLSLSQRCDQSVFTVLLVACLSFSQHSVSSCQVPESSLHRLKILTISDNCLVSFCFQRGRGLIVNIVLIIF